jgi:hypothetical protein
MLLWTGISRVRVHVMNKSGAAHRVTGDSRGRLRLPGAALPQNRPDPRADFAGLAIAMAILFKIRQPVIVNRPGLYCDVRH